MITAMRSFLSLCLASALTLLAPGHECYAALGRASAPGPAGRGAPLVPAVPRAASLTPSALPGPKSSVLSPALTPAGLRIGGPAPASAKASEPGAAPQEARPTLDALSLPAPDFSRMGDEAKDASAADFLIRAGLEKEKTSEEADLGEVPVRPSAGLPAALGPSRGSSPRNGPAAGLPSPVARAARMGVHMGGAALAGGLLPLKLLGFAFYIVVVVPSLIVHEMGHGLAAVLLGDRTPIDNNRLSLRHLHTHIDFWKTLVWPLGTYLLGGFIFGMAKPMPYNSDNFTRLRGAAGQALVAFAGPAANFALAGLGAFAFKAMGGVGGGLGGHLAAYFFATATIVNVALALFNLLPFHPFDGNTVFVRPFLGKRRAAYDQFNENGYFKQELDEEGNVIEEEPWGSWIERKGYLPWLPFAGVVILSIKTDFLSIAVAAVASFLLDATVRRDLQVASAALPAMAAAGLMLGALRQAGGPGGAGAPIQPPKSDSPAEYVVILDSARKPLTKDAHLAFAGRWVSTYQSLQKSMLAQLEEAGLSPELLKSFDATPVATYKRINAVTLRLDASRAGEFFAKLKETGRNDQVFPNDKRKIIKPVPVGPENASPEARKPVTMEEVLRITRMDKVHAITEKIWGSPSSAGGLRRAFLSLVGAVIPQPPVAIIDSGFDTSHPLLKGVKPPVNVTTGENKDDIGHGTWVTSQALNFAKWLRKLTHYKTFLEGSATLDDILKALTKAANDGNLVVSNSWGSDDGDPSSPDSLLVKKLGQESHLAVFAAGNAGPEPNTVGSPAIVSVKDGRSGAERVLAVAASDREKKIASFSSRGPGSPKTKGDPAYPHKPDASGVGQNIQGAWPAALGDADQTGPQGPVKAISGTSMSTPVVFGVIIHLAQLFGVTEKGEGLDRIAKAVMDTLAKTGQSRDAEGGGFVDAYAAYERLVAQGMKPARPNFAARAVVRTMRLLRLIP